MNARRLSLAVGLLMATAGLAGCSSSDSAGGEADQKTLKLAAIMPMTGPAAAYGVRTVDMMKLVVDETNKAGGVEVGGEKFDLELKSFDDENNPEKAQSAGRDAMDQGYELIVGPFGSGTSTAVQPLMAKGGAMWIINIAQVDSPTVNTNVFKTSADVTAAMLPQLDWIADRPEIKKIALLTDQSNPAFFQTTKTVLGKLKDMDREVVASEMYQAGDTDFRAPLTEMINSGADLIMVRGLSTEATLATKQTRELGSKVPMMWNASQSATETRSLVDDLTIMKDVYQSAPLTSLEPFAAAGNKLALDLQKRIGDKAGLTSAYAYDAMQILLAALKNADSPAYKDVIKAMNELPAAPLAGKTLNTYGPRAGGLLFEERKVNLPGAVVEWNDKNGWVPVP